MKDNDEGGDEGCGEGGDEGSDEGRDEGVMKVISCCWGVLKTIWQEDGHRWL